MLKIENLRKEYKGFSLQCSMEVLPGHITGLIGQNGAGKTTTFKILLGLKYADGGSATLFGKDYNTMTMEDREKLGVVWADSGFSAYLTIRDIIPVLRGLYHQFDEEFFMSQVNRFRLPMDKKIKEYSTGMKAKLKIIVALSHKAKLLILDEPTAGLDVIARDELLMLLRQYMEEDEERAILISSHISSDLESLCDDVYMIHEGSIILHEDTDVLLSDYAVLRLTEEQFRSIDQENILRSKKEGFGYSCLTNQKQYYLDNYPKCVIEKANIDEIITMMILGR